MWPSCFYSFCGSHFSLSLRWHPYPQFTGFLVPPTTGTYTLFINSDDGSRLLLGGVVVIDNGGFHSHAEKSYSVTLNAGAWYSLKWVQCGWLEGLEGRAVGVCPVIAAGRQYNYSNYIRQHWQGCMTFTWMLSARMRMSAAPQLLLLSFFAEMLAAGWNFSKAPVTESSSCHGRGPASASRSFQRHACGQTRPGAGAVERELCWAYPPASCFMPSLLAVMVAFCLWPITEL